jgi:hypothetical protein
MPRGRRANREAAAPPAQYRRSFEPGAVAIDPLAHRRDRLTATGRRRSDIAKKEKCLTAIGRRRGIIAKKKIAKKEFVLGPRRGAPADKNKFRNRRARESAGVASQRAAARASRRFTVSMVNEGAAWQLQRRNCCYCSVPPPGKCGRDGGVSAKQRDQR